VPQPIPSTERRQVHVATACELNAALAATTE
jgi:hypothetical protein